MNDACSETSNIQFKIKISIQTFGYSAKFDVHKKRRKKKEKNESMGFTEMSCFAAGLGKKTGTLRWLIVQQTEK